MHKITRYGNSNKSEYEQCHPIFLFGWKRLWKGVFSLVYDSVEKNSSGVIDETKIKVGLKSRYETASNLVKPKLVTNWNNGSSDYSDFDTLIAAVSILISV